MLLFDGGFLLIGIGLWVFCFIDVLTTPAEQIRNLPKLAWVFIVLIFADLGSIAWLLGGRRWGKVPVAVGKAAPEGRSAGTKARPSSGRATNPDDDEEFLATLRARVEEQRRRAKERDEQNGDS